MNEHDIAEQAYKNGYAAARQCGMGSEVIMAVAVLTAADIAKERTEMMAEDRRTLYRALSLIFSEMQDAAFEKGILRLFDPVDEEKEKSCGK